MRVRAPELPSNQAWLNIDRPLSLQQLRGQVVILDFWTYCCINCLHVLPDLKYLEQKFQDQLTVIGIHSAKFDNEKDVENIRQAILRYDIEHPVLIDSGFEVWEQYAVRAWPTLMVIDPEGYVVSCVAGEGHRDDLEQIVEQLVQEHQGKRTFSAQNFSLKLEKQRQPLITPLAFPGKVLATTASLFITDSGHHRLVISSLEGEVQHLIGTGQSGLVDGCFSEAQFSSPQGMAFDAKNQLLYVADTENHAIRQIDLQRQVVKTIAGTGKQSQNIRPHGGAGLTTKLNSPWDLQQIGNSLFIAMAGAHQIWELQLETLTIATYAGRGAEACIDGCLTKSAFAQPSGITTDGKELLIADSEVSSVRGINLAEQQVRTICGSGELFGFGDVDGSGAEVRLQHCLGVEYFQDYLWVADTYNNKIKRVDTCTGICETVLGGGTGEREDESMSLKFSEPSGLSGIDSFLFIADTNNHIIRRANINTWEVNIMNFPQLCAPDFCFP
ncbi:thioredoxin-like domain-containing protein [Gloeocapsopsis sp. IPPAS B-1203]|uniref:thioredoxin-like domain-containing protein n=1 Tax=Gloeocapsopsis sp. IPPAS B-1203 TaxID=2049454 RepID=UPI0025A06057|nr:thioredoxin-like domain-containing protein [Gloeocapsopsis sp. IPPAS B-1203]